MKNTVIIADLEATCSADRRMVNEIIEIGAVKIIDGKVTETFDTFVKPIKNPVLTNFCKTLTSITQKDIDNAETFKEVLPKFLKWIGVETFTLVSWGGYDINQFLKDCILHSVSSSWIKKHINLKKEFANMKRCKPCGMKKALMMLDIPLEGTHHRGIDDAKNISKIYFKIYDKA